MECRGHYFGADMESVWLVQMNFKFSLWLNIGTDIA
jgi:hypothetical protein